jgi:hypothetical protein
MHALCGLLPRVSCVRPSDSPAAARGDLIPLLPGGQRPGERSPSVTGSRLSQSGFLAHNAESARPYVVLTARLEGAQIALFGVAIFGLRPAPGPAPSPHPALFACADTAAPAQP